MALNAGYTFVNRVPVAASGVTVLDFYVERYPHFSRSEWLACIADGRVTLDGCVAVVGQRLAAGQTLAYFRPPWEEPDVPTDAAVVHCDEALVVFAKPAGLPVLPGSGCQQRTLLHIARQAFGPDVAPVHRIDRGTSGLVVFARTARAAAFCGRGLRDHRYTKTYLARALGRDVPATFELTTPIERVPWPPLGRVSAASPTGKPALTRGRVLRRTEVPGEVLVALEPVTGRTGQLRIHMAAAGWPLVGEPFYGPGGEPRAPAPGAPRPLPGDIGFRLHAWRLALIHPLTHAALQLEAPPPQDLQP